MAIELLSLQEQNAILSCLRCILLERKHIDDWEFPTRLGIDRAALQAVIVRWPDVDDAIYGSAAYLAVNNCLNELCHGLPVSDGYFTERLGVSRAELVRIYQKWKLLLGESSTGIA